MLESFWGHCERVQEQTTEVNVSRSSEFSNSFLFLLDCGILLAIKVRLEAQTHLQRREIKIMMSIFPCFAPSLFPLPGSVCLIVSENIIYSGRKPQAKVGGGRKKKGLYTLACRMVFEICPAPNEWVEKTRGVWRHRCSQPKVASLLAKEKRLRKTICVIGQG